LKIARILDRWLQALAAALLVLVCALPACAQTQGQTPQGTSAPSAPQPPDAGDAESPSLFPHSETSRWWISGQVNFITQFHPTFRSPYKGPNSLNPNGEHATSHWLSLYLGYAITPTLEVFLDPEIAGGHGLSRGFGLGGFTNLDIVRAGANLPNPYLARLMVRKVIALSSKSAATERGPFALATTLPERRIELRFGKVSMADFFDVNEVGSDSHLQFMNWTADNNGAWDYAADTRGYTFGAIVDFESRTWGVRAAEALMPTVANGKDLQWKLSRAHAENFEAELRHGVLPHRSGRIRVLSFVNHANMGIYRQAINDFLAGKQLVPDITAHPAQVTTKYGFGVNLQQSLTSWLTLYGRFGWNNGRTESFAYDEVDQSVAFGGGVRGSKWKRKFDRAGVTFISNAISGDHRAYLALGGKGFTLGDGKLNYGREKIVELYYTVHLWRGVFGAFDLQHINNPGYNRDRGPVVVPSLRVHVEF
jgi:hypothetical protein